MRFTYDADADTLLVSLLPEAEIDRTVEVDENRHVDLDPSGAVVQIEVLWASAGVRLHDIIQRFGLWEHKQFLEDVAESSASLRPVVSA